ncbi:hypothetical protein PR003_g24010 [Phytophthora rubi]|uniref:Uncharacterized protein n=1 Tax=Phytophthora rubi TaxID=129364 RepID=A0A6A4D1W8_9STRA|nr:hypothetical protein PR003_g24010 [Phytophthora rubi]
MTIIYEDYGLGGSPTRRTDLEAGANPFEAPDPPQRGERSVTEHPSQEEVEDLTPLDPEGPGPPLPKEETGVVANPEYARLFTQGELDALEADRPSPAAEEKEDSLLNLSVETLARTRASSPDVLSAPEYWSAWYRRTLAASEEAKRANRDFKAPTTPTASTPRVSAVRPDWSDELNSEENDLISDEVVSVSVKEPNESPPEPVTDERLVAGNICVAFSGSEVEDPTLEEPVVIPFRSRSLIRSVVYQIMLEEEARSELRCPARLDADTSQSEDSSITASTPSSNERSEPGCLHLLPPACSATA